MDKKLASIIKYFAVFDYFPSFEDVYTFFPEKIDKKTLKYAFESKKYTPPQYSTMKKISNIKYQISKRKLKNWRYKIYVKLLSLFPQIKLVGLSGSISMMNAKKDDDIDLFIITAKKRLFTGRFIAMVLAQILGLRRSRKARGQNFLAPVGTLPAGNGESQVAKNFNPSLSSNNETMKQWSNHIRNKVCLNLFFDEKNLKVPKFKQTEFVGHEVLQMKPIIVKDNVYERFLQENEWVFGLFPNSKSKIQSSNVKLNPKSKAQKFGFKILSLICHLDFVIWIFNKTESFLKNLQLTLINRHRTTEIITNTQLWFHPDDFEKKIKL